MFTLDSVTKIFKGVRALSEIDLVIEPSKTTVLLGTSGCGKSTILRLLLGLLTPDAGRVAFGDSPLDAHNLDEIRRSIGYVVQDGGLFPHLTARGNASLVASYLRWESSRIEARIETLLELTQFPSDALDRFPRELSGGQRQRLALMRALMLDPRVLLLDEPLGALDPITRSELQADLKRLFRRLAKTVVLVTHDMGEAAYLGDEIVLLAEGRIVQKGTLDDLVERPEDPFVTKFINAQRNLPPSKEASDS